MRRALVIGLGILLLTAAGSANAVAQGGPPPGGGAPGGAGGPQAPAANGEVRGTVVDAETNTPIAKASVAVRLKSNQSLVAGSVGRDDGTFRVVGLRPGTYYVRVSSLGYAPQSSVEFTVTPAEAQSSIGSIKLAKVAVTLSEVEVKAERDAVTIEPDRNTYRAKDVAATANNASEVLDNVPSVSVDGDGKVSLRGNENVVVQINGRPAPMTGAQLGQFLKTLPSAVIDRVEVIPTPSARQDPEGMAGIINLVLKANTDLGISGGVTVASATVAGRYNGSSNIGYQSGPWTTFSSYGYNADDRDIDGINNRTKLAISGTPLSFTEQDIFGNQVNAGHNFTTTVDYKLNARDVLTNALTLNLRKFNDNSVATYSELNSSRAVLDYYNRVRDSDVKSWMGDYTLAFKRTIAPRTHELSTELRYNQNHDDDDTNLFRLSLAAPGATSAASSVPIDRELDKTDATTQTLNAQLDYTRTLKSKAKLETGFKGTGRWMERDFDVLKDEDGNGTWVPSSLSNGLSFADQVLASYAVLSKGVGKFDLQGNLGMGPP